MLRRSLSAIVVGSALCGCAQSPEPAPAPTPPPARRGLDCPPPTLTTSLGPQSTGVRVRNDSGQQLLVFLDECRGHRRLGSILPDRSRLFGLPSSVYLQGSELVLHVFTQDPEAFHSSHRHSPGVDTVHIEPVAAPNASGSLVRVLGEALFQIEAHPNGPRIILEDNQARTTLRLWCAGPQAVVDVTGLSIEGGPVDAALVFGSGERGPTNPWTHTDEGSIRSPDAFAEPIITRLATNESVQLQFQTPSFYVTITYNTTGMDEAITVLSCVAP